LVLKEAAQRCYCKLFKFLLPLVKIKCAGLRDGNCSLENLPWLS
jgi:hypothetical protein